MSPQLSPNDPKVVLRTMLRNHWNDPAVTSEYSDQHDGFTWRIDDHFNTDWIHTGWYDNSNPNPQVSVTFDSADPGTSTGFDATGPAGNKSAWVENRAYIDTWPGKDSEHNNGLNEKLYAWQLRLRCQLIVLDQVDTPPGAWQSLGIGVIRSPEEPEDTPIGARWRIPVLFMDETRT